MTVDLGLTTVLNFATYTSPYYNYYTSNVIEDQTTHNMLFGMYTTDPTPYPLTCLSTAKNGSLLCMKVKVTNPASILFSKNYTSPCMMDVAPPLTIKKKYLIQLAMY